MGRPRFARPTALLAIDLGFAFVRAASRAFPSGILSQNYVCAVGRDPTAVMGGSSFLPPALAEAKTEGRGGAYEGLHAPPSATLSFFNDGWRSPGASLCSPLSTRRSGGYGGRPPSCVRRLMREPRTPEKGQSSDTLLLISALSPCGSQRERRSTDVRFSFRLPSRRQIKFLLGSSSPHRARSGGPLVAYGVSRSCFAAEETA